MSMDKPVVNLHCHRSVLRGDMKQFLDDLCVEWGFCIPTEDMERIAALSPLTADQFTDELLRADGFVPEHELQWRRKLKRRFTKQFGSDVIN